MTEAEPMHRWSKAFPFTQPLLLLEQNFYQHHHRFRGATHLSDTTEIVVIGRSGCCRASGTLSRILPVPLACRTSLRAPRDHSKTIPGITAITREYLYDQHLVASVVDNNTPRVCQSSNKHLSVRCQSPQAWLTLASYPYEGR